MTGPADVKTGEDYLSMSDEDFKNIAYPAPETTEQTTDVEDKADDLDAADDQKNKEDKKDSSSDADDGQQSDETGDADESDAEDDSSGDEEETADKSNDESASDEAAGDVLKPEDKASPKASEKKVIETDTAPTNEILQNLYAQVMKPFKANGKIVTLKDPEEAVALMQMGANYTRRMQEIAPYRKTITMLEKHDLLDPDKLSFLIDIHEKNPEAIKKLVKDSGIDTLDLDSESEDEYIPIDRSVTDSEMAFRTTLEEVSSSDVGKETIKEINSTWDEHSKNALWENPELLRIFSQQRDLGVYQTITAEMDRQKTLGKISATTPFIQAYKTVGDALAAEGVFDNLNASEASDAIDAKANDQKGQSGIPRKVIATRAATPKSQVANGDKAKAASGNRSTNGLKKEEINPLAMADDEFLEKFRNRL